MRTAILVAVAIVLTAWITRTIVRTGTECGACPSVAEADQQHDIVSGMLERCDRERKECTDERIKLQALVANIDQEARADEQAKMARERGAR